MLHSGLYSSPCYTALFFSLSTDAPRITSHSDDLVVVQNTGPTTLFCTVDALPNATVTWYFGDMMIPVSSIPGVFVNGFLVVTQPDDGAQRSSLLIRPTQPSRSGTYRCVAENIVGMSEQEISVEVQGTLCVFVMDVWVGWCMCVCHIVLLGPSLLSPSAPPQVNIDEQNIDKDENQNTTFTCMVSGVPEPTITWQFDSNRSSVVTNLTQSDKYTITNSSMTRNDTVVMVTVTLTIIGLNLNDTGFYICYATNPAGDDSDRRLLVIRC